MNRSVPFVSELIALAAAACVSATASPVSSPIALGTAGPSDAAVRSSRPLAPASPMPTPSRPATPTPTVSPVVWPNTSIPEYSTVGGGDLALGTDAGSEVIHVVVSNLEEAYDGWDASAYLRSRDGGRTWDRSMMLPGMFPQVAADGRHAYVAYLAYECGSVGVRHSSKAGGRGTWSRVQCLAGGGRDISSDTAPTLAASSGAVYVAALPDPRHVTLWTSRDGGRSWATTRIATRPEGVEVWWPGTVDVVASRAVVAVAWVDGHGSVRARVSSDRGQTWGQAETVGPGQIVSTAGGGGRLAISGATETGSWVSVWTADVGWRRNDLGWAPANASSGSTWGVALSYGPAGQLGAFGSLCAWDDQTGVSTGASTWATSSDGGATWETTAVAECYSEREVRWSSSGAVFLLNTNSEEGYSLAVGP